MFKGNPARLAVWLWLLDNAAWKDTTHDINGKTVVVPRGSVCASTRYMAQEIGVSHKVIRNALSRFEGGQMVGTNGAHGKNIISICNYEKYQDAKKDRGTAGAQQGHSRGTQKEQGNNITTSSNEEDTVREAIEIWNLAASKSGWPRVEKLTRPRLSKIRARLKDCGGIDGWRSALARAYRSPFLTGQTSKPFYASFDWITQPANFTKLMEGNYDERVNSNHPRPNAGGSGPHDSLVAGFAAFANSDVRGSGADSEGDKEAFGASNQTMDCGPGGNTSQPIFHIVNSG
jgi:DNA-binding transcriptional regulator YhcF (GntR family)